MPDRLATYDELLPGASTTIQSFGLEASDVSEFFEGANYNQRLIAAGATEQERLTYFGAYVEFVQKAEAATGAEQTGAQDILRLIEAAAAQDASQFTVDPALEVMVAISSYESGRGARFYVQNKHSAAQIADELLNPANGWYFQLTDGELAYSELVQRTASSSGGRGTPEGPM
ncbi:hypothetical protein DRN67_01820 [Candidatus Micrarchaeota archaeon]|nr:MAG: hypothetical protein DRN67_01820 [Candidatus Micrarchaeota archaeon]